MQKLLLLLILGITAGWIDYQSTDDEQVILFVQAENKIILETEVEALEVLAESMEIPFTMVTDVDGLPSDVTTLPSIYFQNRNGRSRYYGRYNNIGRIKNFIRTCKLSHQQDLPNVKKNVLVWENERADITAPIKVTPLSGNVPKDYNQDVFANEIVEGMVQGMNSFQIKKDHPLTKNTKSFYYNIYPYMDEESNLSLTAEIFSQYNCVKPICKLVKVPIVTGKWKKRKKLYKEAGKLIEAEIMKQIQSSTLGDAFVSVSSMTAVRSWADLGLGLPVAATDELMQYDGQTITLDSTWEVVQPEDNKEPIMIFSFLSPVDNYAGEVKALTGTLELGDDMSMNGATGKFSVDVSDVTMGSKDFDYEVHNKMLKIGLFPDAHFDFENISLNESEPLTLGERQDMTVKGSFNMMGITIPIDVITQVEPVLDDKDILLLSINCSFQLPLLDAFKVEGPDGPSPAKDRLQFYMRFNMKSIN